MDFRSLCAGILLVFVTGAGSVLVGFSLSLPLFGIIGCLMIVLPCGLFLWYLLEMILRIEERSAVRMRRMESLIGRSSDRMNKKYEATRYGMYEIITELKHRIYR